MPSGMTRGWSPLRRASTSSSAVISSREHTDRHPVLADALYDDWNIGVNPVPEPPHVCVIAPWDDRTAVFVDAIEQDWQQQGVLGVVAVEQRRPCRQPQLHCGVKSQAPGAH